MPQIPMYDGPQVQTKGLNFDQANANQFGGGQAREMVNAGAAVGMAANAIDRIAERNTLAEVFDAENKAKEAYTGWSAKALQEGQGAGAKGLTERTQEFWAKTQEEVAKGMTSTQAQTMFGKAMSRQAQASLSEMSRFETQQLELDLGQKTEATVLASQKLAAQIPTPENIAVQEASIKAALGTYGANRWSPEVMKEKVEKGISDMNVGVFNNLLVRDPVGAKNYYEEARKRNGINPLLFDQIEERLKNAVADVAGGEGAREVWGSFMAGKGYNAAVPVDKMDAELVKRFKDEPMLLKAARAELDRSVALFNRAQSETNAAGVNGAAQLMTSGKTLEEIKRTGAWLSMSGTQQVQFAEHYVDRQRIEQAHTIQDRVRAEQELETKMAGAMLIYSQPENLAKMTKAEIQNMMPEIGVNNTTKLLNAWNQYQGSAAKLAEAKVDADAFGTIMSAAGLDPKPSPKDKPAAALVMRARDEVESRIGAEQTAKKRELTRPEKDQIMREVIHAKVLTPGAVYGSNEVLDITLTPEQRRSAYIEVPPATRGGKVTKVPLSSIPPDEYADTVRFLRERGQPIDPTTVARKWYSINGSKK